MSQVNLLPPEIRQREQLRRRTVLIVLIGAGVLALIGFFYFLQVVRLSNVNSDLRTQESVNQGIQGQIGRLKKYAQLQATVAAKQKLESSVFVDEVSWSELLIDISQTIPTDSYITTFTGQITPPVALVGAAPGVTASGTTNVGNVTFAGQSLGTLTVSVWLTRLDQVRGFANPYVTSVAEAGDVSNIYTFSGSADLTPDVVTRRGRGVGT